MSPDLSQVAQALARKFGWRIRPSGDTALNYLGLSTQVAGKVLYFSDGPDREYLIGKQPLIFQKTLLKHASLRHPESALVVEVLDALTQDRFTPQIAKKIRSRFNEAALKTRIMNYIFFTRLGEICKHLEEDDMKEHYLYHRNDVNFSHTVEQYVKSLEKRISEGDWGIAGIPTGFRDLDCLIGGLKEGELTLLAGRPGMGKTSFALSIVHHLIMNEQKSVGWISLGNDKMVVTTRLLSIRSGLDHQRLLNGFMDPDEFNLVQKAAKELSATPLHIRSFSGIDLDELDELILSLKGVGAKVVVIDSLSEIFEFVDARRNKRKFFKISKKLKQIAEDYEISLVVVSRLRRSVENRKDHYPCSWDLPGCGSIAMRADNVLLIYREEYYFPTERNQGVTLVIISRCNSSRQSDGICHAFLKKGCMRFEMMEKPS